jgi:dTDP-glucose pyrophosphorylase/CBS domain-containing protein
MCKIQDHLINPQSTIRECMTCIDGNSKGIALVVDSERRLLGTISDGDIRRAILKGTDLDAPVQTLLIESKRVAGHPPVTARTGTTDADLLQLMNKEGVRQIPIVDEESHVVDISFLTDLVREYELPMTAVVMAGGFGHRLRPLTEQTPKPMLPIGDRPMLERTIEQLRNTGIRRVSLTTHYKAEVISDHFGNGKDFGVTINYVHENQPLGTAGAIKLLEFSEDPLLVINGDILTHVDFRAMLAYHQKHEACLTVGVRQYDLQVPYGVMECDGAKILKVSEKPKLQFLVNAGIYLLDPNARNYIPSDRKFDMTDLIQSLISEKRNVISFPILEYWLDIGQHSDYEKAKSDFANGRFHS